MTYDIYFLGFAGGEPRDGGGRAMREVLQPYLVEVDPESDFLRIRCEEEDGWGAEADIYLHDDSMMANHIEGLEPWDVLLRGAQAADWVIVPVDEVPCCITREEQRAHLPPELAGNVALVTSRAELFDAIGIRPR